MKSCNKQPHETKNISLSDKEDINKKATKKGVSSKKYGRPLKYKVPLKSEQKVNSPIKEVYNDKYKFHCLPCAKNLSCYHQGLGDVRVHCSGSAHKTHVKSWNKETTLSFSNNQDLSFQNKVTRAQVMVSNFLVQRNSPLVTADQLQPLFKIIFPDGKIASSYSSARPKTTAIVNEAFGTLCHDLIVQHCQNYPYSCDTDGSNDTGIQKMNPVSIHINDANTSKVAANHFYNMCLTEGEHGATAESIFVAIENNFDYIPFQNCVSLNVDNASNMVRKRNSLASRFKDKN